MYGYKPDFTPVKRPAHRTAGRLVQFANGEVKHEDGRSIDFHDYLTGMSANCVVMAVIGNFMRPSGLLPNGLVIVNKAIRPKVGDIAGVRINGDNLIRRILKQDGKYYLVADDPRDPPYEIKEGDHVEMIGKVVRSINSYL